MAGHNHYPWCTCGWCTSNRIGSSSYIDESYSHLYNWDHDNISKIYSYESFVNPNARCPVCGERVFFYQSPYGGKVFFDFLGPPWPKHPCTTHGKAPLPILAKNAHVDQEPIWKVNGWEPYICKTIYKNPKYLKITLVNDHDEITKIIWNISIDIKEGTLVHVRKMNNSLYEASLLLNNNEPYIALLSSSTEGRKDYDSLENIIMQPYDRKTIKSLKFYDKIDDTYYEKLIKDKDTSIIMLSYIFFRFFNNKGFSNSIIEHPVSKKTKMDEIFNSLIQLGIKGFMDKFYTEYRFYKSDHIKILKNIRNSPLANGIKKIIEVKEKKAKSINIQTSFSQKGWVVK